MKELLLVWLVSGLAFAHLSKTDDDAERDFHPAYLSQATGVLRAEETHRYKWPVKLLSIGHSIASYQNYGGGAPYFHHGLDVRADVGAPVFAAVGGKVVNVENYQPPMAVYWEVAILDDAGFIWQYHHIDPNSIPQNIHDAFQSGGSVPAGTQIGSVVYWPEVTFGERYHHIHVNVLGAGKKYLNPFAFLEPLHDTQGPQVEEIGILKNGRKFEGDEASGNYSLYAEVSDLILHDKFIVPPHFIGFQMDGAPVQTVWSFDSLPGGASDTEYVHDFFVKSMTCGNYVCRKLVVDLGFKPGSHLTFPQTIGQHRLALVVRDFAGNEARRDYSWTVSGRTK